MAECLSKERIDELERDNNAHRITEAGWHYEVGPNLISTIRERDKTIAELTERSNKWKRIATMHAYYRYMAERHNRCGKRLRLIQGQTHPVSERVATKGTKVTREPTA